jgi:hypothetical protein
MNMESRYRNELPAQLLPLVDRIEASAGAEIKVIVDASLKTEAEARPHMVNGVFQPTIVFQGALSVAASQYREPYSIACHELLHLERYFIEWAPLIEIPGLTFSLRRTGKLLGEGELPGGVWSGWHLENTLEHLVIEPRQADYGFKLDFGVLRKFWAMNTPVRPANRWALIDWLYTDFLAPEEMWAAARRALAPGGLLEDALMFSKLVRAALGNKEALALIATSFLRIPPDNVRLLYLRGDVPGMAAYKPLPESMTLRTPEGEIRLGLTPAEPPKKQKPRMPAPQWKRRKHLVN